uniref:Uncharacterized protein n=1 Tax=Arundo donax TaxID=35708 RepID=A0A0A9HQ24_ARUDO
MSPTGRSSG